MHGDLEAAFARARSELESLGIRRSESLLAVDLGAGFGLHSLPLAELGYRVMALDRCRPLLDELARRAVDKSIDVVDSDLTAFGNYVTGRADLILCMGDTLTHLPTLGAVVELLREVGARLANGGRFVVTFRDYSRPLSGDSRFIPVRSTATQILTCFLEFHSDHVDVHDVLHRLVDGQWRLDVSHYPKLRLNPDWLVAQLAGLGFHAATGKLPNGMISVVATRAGAG
jgi:SAM-dependent methyltransferase